MYGPKRTTRPTVTLIMTIGTEMTTFNETVKTNIKSYVTMNNTLVATLKDGLLKKLKE